MGGWEKDVPGKNTGGPRARDGAAVQGPIDTIVERREGKAGGEAGGREEETEEGA